MWPVFDPEAPRHLLFTWQFARAMEARLLRARVDG
jgi:hypothetical protein